MCPEGYDNDLLVEIGAFTTMKKEKRSLHTEGSKGGEVRTPKEDGLTSKSPNWQNEVPQAATEGLIRRKKGGRREFPKVCLGYGEAAKKGNGEILQLPENGHGGGGSLLKKWKCAS